MLISALYKGDNMTIIQKLLYQKHPFNKPCEQIFAKCLNMGELHQYLKNLNMQARLYQKSYIRESDEQLNQKLELENEELLKILKSKISTILIDSNLSSEILYSYFNHAKIVLYNDVDLADMGKTTALKVSKMCLVSKIIAENIDELTQQKNSITL